MLYDWKALKHGSMLACQPRPRFLCDWFSVIVKVSFINPHVIFSHKYFLWLVLVPRLMLMGENWSKCCVHLGEKLPVFYSVRMCRCLYYAFVNQIYVLPVIKTVCSFWKVPGFTFTLPDHSVRGQRPWTDGKSFTAHQNIWWIDFYSVY